MHWLLKVSFACSAVWRQIPRVRCYCSKLRLLRWVLISFFVKFSKSLPKTSMPYDWRRNVLHSGSVLWFEPVLSSCLSVFAEADLCHLLLRFFCHYMLGKMSWNKIVEHLLMSLLSFCRGSAVSPYLYSFLSAGCSACGRCPQFRWGSCSCPGATTVGQCEGLTAGGWSWQPWLE